MALTGHRYFGDFEGHTIEMIRNNWNKTLRLVIDGAEVARESCHFPGRLTLTGSLEHNGVRYTVVGKSVPYRLVFAKQTIEIDGKELPFIHEKPRGLLKMCSKMPWAVKFPA